MVNIPVQYRPGWEQKTTKVSTKSPSLKDIHWIAGFIEGEGCFTFPYTITVGQVQREPLDRLLAFLGGNIRTRARQGNKQQAHSVWTASGKRGRGILMTLYSLMSPKRKLQALKALGKELKC